MKTLMNSSGIFIRLISYSRSKKPDQSVGASSGPSSGKSSGDSRQVAMSRLSARIQERKQKSRTAGELFLIHLLFDGCVFA